MNILYVEDNDDNVYMLKNRLSRAGFTVTADPDLPKEQRDFARECMALIRQQVPK